MFGHIGADRRHSRHQEHPPLSSTNVVTYHVIRWRRNTRIDSPHDRWCCNWFARQLDWQSPGHTKVPTAPYEYSTKHNNKQIKIITINSITFCCSISFKMVRFILLFFLFWYFYFRGPTVVPKWIEFYDDDAWNKTQQQSITRDRRNRRQCQPARRSTTTTPTSHQTANL